ncbi:maleylpyruvate isomerase N-terminal domain-containing protein [Herbiconiux sp.]|uniref:maleylpyruvate isomerase N-terminal domain-containing protein n=1 Tax=Herbiconiux sp. TaxID=1871186 RepID=UPI0025BD53A4|nr:maleylpyruvate isomerase N-terminal domain-containing protein [Herbiconiux sp.]
MPRPVVDPRRHLEGLELGIARLREVLAHGELAAPVAGCPGWSLADLGIHVGSVYGFAHAGLVEHREFRPEHTGARGRDEVLAFFDAGADALLGALRAIDAADDWNAEAWTMAPPATAAFWVRRQHHETSLHLWDALESQGVPRDKSTAEALDDDTAADGIDEIARMFYPRQVRLKRVESLTESLEIRTPGREPVRLGTVGTPSAVLTGAAPTVLLALWKRVALEAPGLTVSGDPRAAARVVASPITP